MWTQIYNWEDNPSVIVVGAGQALYDGQGRPMGVAGVDLFLGEISHFLAKLRISPQARSFIIDRQGLFVATSTGQPIFRMGDKGAERLSAIDAEDGVIRAVSRRMRELPNGLPGIKVPFGESIAWDEGELYLRVTPWRDRYGLDWLIVVTVPESDFARTIRDNHYLTLAMTALFGLIGVSAALFGAGLVTRPIRRLEQAARQVAGGQLHVGVEGSSFREFNQLSEAFNSMTAQLRGAFARAEQAQSQLEQQVRERTERLRQANVELERLTRIDSLTQLANRRRFDPQLREEWQRAQRNAGNLALVLCDIDHFKEYNDRYGHLQGDEALRQVAACLSAAIGRSGDLAARYGGEEFALLLPNTDKQGALSLVQELGQLVRDLDIEHQASKTGLLTLSFGLACMDETRRDYVSEQQLFEAADKALYAAKQAGRDTYRMT